MKINITNQTLYEQLVDDVEIDMSTELSNFPHPPHGFVGDVTIHLMTDKKITITGEHGLKDYEEEYGFVFEP